MCPVKRDEWDAAAGDDFGATDVTAALGRKGGGSVWRFMGIVLSPCGNAKGTSFALFLKSAT
jgi:hypothetical protein